MTCGMTTPPASSSESSITSTTSPVTGAALGMPGGAPPRTLSMARPRKSLELPKNFLKATAQATRQISPWPPVEWSGPHPLAHRLSRGANRR
jgi:hypothetical protein